MATSSLSRRGCHRRFERHASACSLGAVLFLIVTAQWIASPLLHSVAYRVLVQRGYHVLTMEPRALACAEGRHGFFYRREVSRGHIVFGRLCVGAAARPEITDNIPTVP
jgi:hypothetical protein